MPIEGIIDGLREIADQYDLGRHNEYIRDAVEALSRMDAELDKAYEKGKYVQLCEDFEALIGGITA